MKKIICVLLSLIVLFSFVGCTYDNTGLISAEGDNGINDEEYVTAHKSNGDVANITDVKINNSYYDNLSTDTYLTDDYFFYTSYDAKSSFGDGCAIMAYDLHTAKTEPINMDYYYGGVRNMFVIDNNLYFTAYSVTGAKDEDGLLPGGYCLFEYNISSKEAKRIFATPNTMSGVCSFVCGNKLYYIASTMKQDHSNANTSLYLYEKGESKLIKSLVNKEDFMITIESDGNTAKFFLNDEQKFKVGYSVDTNSSIKSIKYSPKSIKNSDNRKFGNWKITSVIDKSTENDVTEDDCGYEYTTTYHIKNGKKDYKLATAAYWYYYI